jgi:AcrR family transcriptional regulator
VAPRTYELGRRAETATATRQRILAAARALYLERGVRATTLKAIAERADVSRGTILHHFGDADGLIEAVATDVLASLEMPDERILDGIESAEGRIRTFVDAMVRFFERSTPWWTVFEPEMHRPALQARDAEYSATVGRLQAAALGEGLATDRIASATVSGLLHPATLGAFIWTLQSSGLSLDEVIDVVGDLLVPMVARAPVAPGPI